MKLLKDKPQKDRILTEYKCGLTLHGGWATRLKKHDEFINPEIGRYIRKFESDNKKN